MQQKNSLYVLVVFGMAALGVLALVLIAVLRPEQDNTIIVGQIMALIVPTTAALMALISSGANSQAIKEVHVKINSRMDEMLAQTATIARSAGVTAAHAETALTAAATQEAVTAARSEGYAAGAAQPETEALKNGTPPERVTVSAKVEYPKREEKKL